MDNSFDWADIGYLKSGNSRQRQTYRILQETNILCVLEGYEPIVTGTIPIGIDVEGSDIDIACHAPDLESFGKYVRSWFSAYGSFADRIKDDEKAYVAGFIYSGREIEIFAQNKPSVLQNGFRHMLVEERILRLAGEGFRQRIIGLKQQGIKTEPAFGLLLNLENPYSDLLDMEKYSDKELILMINAWYKD